MLEIAYNITACGVLLKQQFHVLEVAYTSTHTACVGFAKTAKF